jgi:hypothetical protein
VNEERCRLNSRKIKFNVSCGRKDPSVNRENLNGRSNKRETQKGKEKQREEKRKESKNKKQASK